MWPPREEIASLPRVCAGIRRASLAGQLHFHLFFVRLFFYLHRSASRDMNGGPYEAVDVSVFVPGLNYMNKRGEPSSTRDCRRVL